MSIVFTLTQTLNDLFVSMVDSVAYLSTAGINSMFGSVDTLLTNSTNILGTSFSTGQS